MDAASYFLRPAILHKTPRLSPPPPVANPDDTERVVTKSAHTSKTHQEFENKIGSQGLSLDGDISPETNIKRSNNQIFNKVSITELPEIPRLSPPPPKPPPGTNSDVPSTDVEDNTDSRKNKELQETSRI